MVLGISLSQVATCLKPVQLFLPTCRTVFYLCIKQQQLLKHDNVTEKQESKYALASMLDLHSHVLNDEIRTKGQSIIVYINQVQSFCINVVLLYEPTCLYIYVCLCFNILANCFFDLYIFPILLHESLKITENGGIWNCKGGENHSLPSSM